MNGRVCQKISLALQPLYVDLDLSQTSDSSKFIFKQFHRNKPFRHIYPHKTIYKEHLKISISTLFHAHSSNVCCLKFQLEMSNFLAKF